MYIKKLDISYSPNIDAFCMDRLTGEYQDSLEYLDLSGCTLLNWNGLECLWRLRKLKVLVLQDMDHIKDLHLLCIMLLEILPDLQIRGVDYMANAPSLLAGTEEESLLADLDNSLLLLTDGNEVLNTETKTSVEGQTENFNINENLQNISSDSVNSNIQMKEQLTNH